MKILLDACVWGGAATVLRSAGHDVDWVGDWSAGPPAGYAGALKADRAHRPHPVHGEPIDVIDSAAISEVYGSFDAFSSMLRCPPA